MARPVLTVFPLLVSNALGTLSLRAPRTSGALGGAMSTTLHRCYLAIQIRSRSLFILLFLTACVTSAHAQRISIEVQDGSGKTIASANSSSKKRSTTLTLNHEYQAGDRIIVHGPQWMTLHISDEVPECSVFLSSGAHHSLTFEVPYGGGEQQTGSAYSPGSFAGTSHSLTISPVPSRNRLIRRNLALNPCDARTSSPTLFPHASTNSVSRDAYDFEARNAIDGAISNRHHGEWPYQSWGPLIRTDLWWKLEFGREVQIDTLRIMLRTDFPHDSYWKSAVVEFSDGTSLPLEMTSTSDFQDFHFPAKRVSWLRLTHLVSTENRWSALIEFEAWGNDLY